MLAKLYAPFVYHQCRRMGVPQQDGPDIVQDVFRKVAANLSRFRREKPGDSFRAWLTTITRNVCRDYFRQHAGRPAATGGTDMQRQIQQAPDNPGDVSTTTSDRKGSEASGSKMIVSRAAQLVRDEFEEHTWNAFWMTTVDALSPATAAEQLGMTRNAVYQARSRILRRLRSLLEDFGEG